MSKFFVGFLNSDQLAALHNAGHILDTAALSAGDHVLTIIKANPIATLIANDIATLKDSTLSGEEKAAKVVASAVPLIASLASGGVVTLVASVENTARLVVQSLYNDTVGAVKSATGTADMGKQTAAQSSGSALTPDQHAAQSAALLAAA